MAAFKMKHSCHQHVINIQLLMFITLQWKSLIFHFQIYSFEFQRKRFLTLMSISRRNHLVREAEVSMCCLLFVHVPYLIENIDKNFECFTQVFLFYRRCCKSPLWPNFLRQELLEHSFWHTLPYTISQSLPTPHSLEGLLRFPLSLHTLSKWTSPATYLLLSCIQNPNFDSDAR